MKTPPSSIEINLIITVITVELAALQTESKTDCSGVVTERKNSDLGADDGWVQCIHYDGVRVRIASQHLETVKQSKINHAD